MHVVSAILHAGIAGRIAQDQAAVRCALTLAGRVFEGAPDRHASSRHNYQQRGAPLRAAARGVVSAEVV